MGLTIGDFPNLMSEWDYDKNQPIDPLTVPFKSNRKFFWKCKLGHTWQTSPEYRVISNTKCPFCSGKKVLAGFNDLAFVYPETLNEWDYEKNAVPPNDILFTSHKSFWWKCRFGHQFQQTIQQRISVSNKCPICFNRRGRGAKLDKNILGDCYPDLLKDWDYEKNIFSPYEISFNSKRKVWWKCPKNHSYQMSVQKRAVRGFGCPVCSNHQILKGYNDLATIRPDLVDEWHSKKNGSLTPYSIGAGSNRKVWWICSKGHEWEARICDRAISNNNCPVCSIRRCTSFPEQAIYFYCLSIFSDTQNRYKKIFSNGMELDVFIPCLSLGIEFDGRVYHKSDSQHLRELKKYEICKENHIKLIRIKEKQGIQWSDTADEIFYINKTHHYGELESLLKPLLLSIVRGSILDNKENLLNKIESMKIDFKNDRSAILGYLNNVNNNLALERPDVAELWDYDKNFPLIPNMFSTGSNESVWWICPVCKKSSKTTINSKTSNVYLCCPRCAAFERGKTFTKNIVNKVGSMEETNAKMAADFDYSKNGNLTPKLITANCNKEVWWRCHKCGYEWSMSPNRRKNSGCPHCSGRVAMPGVDDLLTLKPDIAKEWDYEKNTLLPSQVKPGSGIKVWWKCSICGHEWKTEVRYREHIGCKRCFINNKIPE